MQTESGLRLSVLVAAFNVEKWIAECLDSLKQQSLKEVEFIVVDDASTDRTGEICKRYADVDGRFSIVRSPVNRGLLATRRAGIQRARGAFLIFVDGDDYLADSEALMRVVEAAERENLDIIDIPVTVVGNSDRMEIIDGVMNKKCAVRKLNSALDIIKNTYLTGSGPSFHLLHRIYRTSLVQRAEAYYEPEHRGCAEDVYECFVISYFARTWSQIDIKPAYCYRVGDGVSTGALTFERFRARARSGDVFRMLRTFLDGQNAPKIYYECVRSTERSVADRCACELLELPIDEQAAAKRELDSHFPNEVLEPAIWIARNRLTFRKFFHLAELLFPENTVRRRLLLRGFHGTVEALRKVR